MGVQPVLHDWCNKGRGICYPVCGMVHIKEPLMLIGKSNPCGGSAFPLSLSEWSLTICLTFIHSYKSRLEQVQRAKNDDKYFTSHPTPLHTSTQIQD